MVVGKIGHSESRLPAFLPGAAWSTLVDRRIFTLLLAAVTLFFAARVLPAAETTKLKVYSVTEEKYIMIEKVHKTEAQWKRQLSVEAYHVLREKGTEAAFTGEYWNNHSHGTYRCAACGLDLFSSNEKYDSGTGWPSFYAPVAPENVATEEDDSFFMRRTEVLCRRCGSHLGHVFGDGPRPTGLRYCINSAALEFVKRPEGA